VRKDRYGGSFLTAPPPPPLAAKNSGATPALNATPRAAVDRNARLSLTGIAGWACDPKATGNKSYSGQPGKA
jgi:hypothetical protein